MDLVYHEKQEGRLCGQHCLNNLLQGQYFTAVELASLAQQMDLAERKHMAEAGVNTEDFKRFMEQPSGNMDDTGMFSVQVLTSALRVWDLSLTPITSTTSTLAQLARSDPQEQQAFICNYKSHWFTVRKLGYQWFNLNSLLSYPELISNTYLSLFLTQLQHEGYSIFLVEGRLPPTEADETLRLHPAHQDTPPTLCTQVSSGSSTTLEEEEEDEELKEALALSLSSLPHHSSSSSSSYPSSSKHSQLYKEKEEGDLQRALQLSLTCGEGVKSQEGQEGGEKSRSKSQSSAEEEDLEVAIKMSLEDQDETNASSEAKVEERGEPTLEEIRERRFKYFTQTDS